ncbi:zinc knuckle CX2CX4HX4C containing protein [Tanacetum coccineum]
MNKSDAESHNLDKGSVESLKSKVDKDDEVANKLNAAIGKSLIDILNANKMDNKLMNIPTGKSKEGVEVVVFDDELIELGSRKWKGQFIGCSMSLNEVRYHFRRMWHRFGLRDVIAENGIFFFKFQDEEGIKEVINNGPWMVNSKPMFVQKWNIDMCLDKAEPKKLPVWIKLMNIPMEAWSVKGISAIASMEIDAEKEVKNTIEILYKSKKVNEGTRKMVYVEYAWRPCVCTHCKVFGHEDKQCMKLISKKVDVPKEVHNEEEFVVVQNRRKRMNGNTWNRNEFGSQGRYENKWNGGRNNKNTRYPQEQRMEYRRRNMTENNSEMGADKDGNGGASNNAGIRKDQNATNQEVVKDKNKNNNTHDCNVQKSKMGDRHIGTSSTIGNTLLESVVREEDLIPSIDKRRIVDETMRTKKVISNEDMVEWSDEMKRYFKDKKELFETAMEFEKDENVLEVNKGGGAVGDTLV